jgi:hypothetical protein
MRLMATPKLVFEKEEIMKTLLRFAYLIVHSTPSSLALRFDGTRRSFEDQVPVPLQACSTHSERGVVPVSFLNRLPCRDASSLKKP